MAKNLSDTSKYKIPKLFKTISDSCHKIRNANDSRQFLTNIPMQDSMYL